MHDEVAEPTSPDGHKSATHETEGPGVKAAEVPARSGHSFLPPVMAGLEKTLLDQNRLLGSVGTQLIADMNKASKYYQATLSRLSPTGYSSKTIQQMMGFATDPQFMKRTAEFAKAVEAYRAPLLEADWFVQQQSLAQRYADTLTALGQHISLADLTTLPSSFNPPNWGTLAEAEIDTAMAVLRDEGVPLAWIPRPAIVSELVNAPDNAARLAILTTRIPEIIIDCGEALDDVTDPDLKSEVEMMRRALLCLGAVPDGAQALATNVFDTFLRGANRRGRMFGASFGYFKYDKVTKRITKVSDDTPLEEFRIACVLSPAIVALRDFDPGGSALPTEFGRHATVHQVDPMHYTPANAAIAVMLATSFLREAQASGW